MTVTKLTQAALRAVSTSVIPRYYLDGPAKNFPAIDNSGVMPSCLPDVFAYDLNVRRLYGATH